MNDPSEKIHMIGLDGRVRYIPVSLKKKLLAVGWGIISNPKEEYFPQYDRVANPDNKNISIIENEETDSVLEVEKL